MSNAPTYYTGNKQGQTGNIQDNSNLFSAEIQAEFEGQEITESFRSDNEERSFWQNENKKLQDVIPLRKEPQEESLYPIEAFGKFAEALKTFADGVQVPYSMAGNTMLTALCLCVQNTANIITDDGRSIPIVIQCISSGDSGDRKTALDKVVFHAIHLIEKEAYKEYKKALTLFDLSKKKWDLLPKKEKEAKPFEESTPVLFVALVENANIEGIIRVLHEGNTSLAICSSEAGILFGGIAFLKENLLKTITTFSKFWDGDVIDKVRSGEATIKLYDRRVSMHSMLQPHILERLFSNEDMQLQGYLPRNLIASPKTLKGTRLYRSEDVRNNPKVQDFYRICRESFLRKPRIDEETGGLIFNNLYLSKEAHKLWILHYNDIETKLTPDSELMIISAYASKNAEQALRIAGIFTLAENQNATYIEVDTMKNAIILARWYLSEALRLRQNSITPKEILLAEKLLDFLRRKKIKYFNTRYIVRNSALRDKKTVDTAIKTLIEHNYITKGKGEAIIDDKKNL